MSDEELTQALALVFRRFRGKKASQRDLVKVMSLTLNWAKPSEAPHLLARAVDAGLLERHGDEYAPTFDVNAADVAFGFRPDDALFEAYEATGPAASEPETSTGATAGQTGEPADDPGAPPDAGPEAEPPTEPGSEPGSEPGGEPGGEPGSEPGSEPETEPETEPATGPQKDRPPRGAPDTHGESSTVLDGLIDAIADEAGTDRKAAVAAVNAKQEQLDGVVTMDAAALIVAAEHGLDVGEEARAVLEALRTTSATR